LAEDKIGIMLPCNVIVQQLERWCGSGGSRSSGLHAVVREQRITEIAKEIQSKLKSVIERFNINNSLT
jgi:uncharacterized protein (DUF302 family)